MLDKIIIIGAGISGLVTGILLRQSGFNVEIYEKRSSIAPIGGGLGIWPNGAQILMNLPCAKKILSLAGIIENDVFADANGNTLIKIPRELFLQVNGCPIINVCRSELHQVLADEFGLNNIKFATKCIGVQQESSHVIVRFDNHFEAKADLLIGADGTYSSVRRMIFPETKLIYSGYLQLLGVLRHPSTQPPQHNFIIGKNRYYLQLPISNDRHIFYQVIPYKQGEIQRFTTQQECISLFRGWSQEADALLDIYEQSLTQDEFRNHFYCDESYTMSQLSKWHDHRVVLIGDAAHPIGSIMGLGAGCALEDSSVLVSKLKNKKITDAISEYEQQQIPRMFLFYQLEKKMTDFILNANNEEYNQFISELKSKTSFEASRELINCLKQQEIEKIYA
jgi:FAD-dependent urate hydroxylase